VTPFAARLVAWQEQHGRRDLPWQNTRDAYRIWISEIMLQQTQVATVLPYYQRFMSALPDVASLAEASIDTLLGLWSGLGYYRRAHLMHRAAREIVSRHDGVFPSDAAGLETLPGIGRSTAAAIAAFAYGERAAILDGNVKRVLARHEGIEGHAGESAVEEALWARAEALLPPTRIETYTQALMDLGATVCLRSTPLCGRCPVAEDCVARLTGRIDELPRPRPRKPVPQREVSVLLIGRDREILLERRAPTGIWAGLWSLPEVEHGADVASFCRERFGVEVAASEALEPIEHAFTHFRLRLTPLVCRVLRWPARIEDSGRGACVWLPLDDAAGAALPAPIKKLLRSLATRPVGALQGH
jgi:A/G-specific adenine glycosylase